MPQKPIDITHETARERGTEDGRMGYPPARFNGSAGQISEFEQNLAHVANRQLSEQVMQWQKSVGEVLKELKTLVPDLIIASNELIRSITSHQERFGGEARPETKHKSTAWMIAGLAVIFLIEVFVNASTFKTLREPTLITYILGFGISVLAPLSGFLVGRLIKNRDRTRYETAMAIGFFVVAVALIWVVAESRELAMKKPEVTPEEVREAFFIFLFMNILLFLFAIWHGFNTGYKFPDLQKRMEEFRTRKHQYGNRWERLNAGLVECLGTVRQLVAQAHSLQVTYQAANRSARHDVGIKDVPAYFDNNTRLPIENPKELDALLDIDDPTSQYHSNLLKNHRYAFLQEAETAIAQIDDRLEGKTT